MEYEMKNEYLKVRIAPKGGELRSVCDKYGQEYLWQGDAATWQGHGLNLFPYVGRLTGGAYLYQKQIYHMGIHGFLMNMEMKPVSCERDTLVMELCACEETRRQYPFLFALRIQWQLRKESLEITYQVRNQDEKTMYFGIGGHPGFRIPLEEGLAFEDYYLDFGKESEPLSLGLSEDNFMSGRDIPFPLREKRYLDLSRELFVKDSVVLRETSRQVTLRSRQGTKAIRVEYPGMTYLVLWVWPGREVSFLCLEPWSSLPSRKNVTEDLEAQSDLISLEAGNIYENKWSISILNKKDIKDRKNFSYLLA